MNEYGTEKRVAYCRWRAAGEPLPVGATYLFHDAGLSLGEGDVASRFVVDEFDFNLATFATALLFVFLFILTTGALALDAATLGRATVADRLRFFDFALRRGLLVLFGNVGHGE